MAAGNVLQQAWSAACERNREPILQGLRPWFADRRRVLEIGSGTGQHAVHFARAMPHLAWQASDVAEHLPAIRARVGEAGLANTPPPLALDVEGEWPAGPFDALFTANTLHIMAWRQVERLFARLPVVLGADATLAIYGPFNRGGAFTSDSNAAFDATLKRRAAHMGLRDIEAVHALADASGFAAAADIAMPANNALLVWRRQH